MQKGKHQGGQTQGYPPRNYSAYPGNTENSRQYQRGEVGPAAFHASGTPGGGPGMRGMHHAQPTQPPTPPTSQDLKQQPAHLPPQPHQIPPQSGPMMAQYNMTGAGRNSNQQPQFYSARVQPGQQRMAHSRSPMVMPNNSQQFMPQPGLVQPVPYPQTVQVQGQPPFIVSGNLSHHFPVQQSHQRGNIYPPTQFFAIPQSHMVYPTQQGVYYSQPLQQLQRTGSSGPVPSSQGAAPPQAQPGSVTVVTGPGGMVPAPAVPPPAKQSRQKKPLAVIDPNSGRNVIEDMFTGNTPPRSGESSARQTPQPNSGESTDRDAVAAEFAKKVAIAAQGGSPNSHSLQQPLSRTSNYSENDSQASPDPQGASPSKLDTSVESISSESQIVENHIPYETNQQPTMIRGWPPVMEPPGMPAMHHVLGGMPIHTGIMMNADDLMRGPPPNQPREYQAVPTPWMTADGQMPVPVIIEKPPNQVEAPVRPARERETPVVSALAHAPTVDIPPRPRDHFPALKGHQQQSPVKRKQRSEQTQEQAESKVKEQQQQHQQQPQPQPLPPQQMQPPALQQPQPQPQAQQQLPQQQPLQQQQPQQPSKVMSQPKPKQVTPISGNKKQSTPPSQDCDEYVQSIQTKNNEQKTVVIKSNDSDSSETKSKSSDILTNKENNNLETRNLNEEIIQENNNRNKSDVIKCDAPVSKESSPIPLTESSGKSDMTDEVQEESSSTSATATEDVPANVEDNSPSKTNGETISDDAKSNNQKSKNNSKRTSQPAQPNMRLDKKETKNAEVKAPVSDVTPAPALPTPETKIPPTVVVNCEQPTADDELKTKNEAVTDEDKEKEKEDLMVAAKNEENNKQTASMKTNDLTHAQVIENVNKVGQPVLKHNYKDGQWSPLNQDGKRKYDRDFIMELMHDPQSKKRPTNLPEFGDLIKDNKQRAPDRNFINSISRGHEGSLMPQFANKNSSQRGPGQPGIAKRLSQQGKQKQTKPPVIHMSLSLHQDVKLHEAENAWKPARVTDHNNMTEEEAKTDALYKRVRGVLNKLTPQKFGKLVEQVRALPIDNLARLQGVIDLVFKKAIDEPSFSVAYAQMCQTLHKMCVPSGQVDHEGNPIGVNFRKLLIDKCQHEFEKNTAAELKRDERLKEINAETDLEKKKQLQLTYEEEERRIRMKSVGNIRFIGELYKLNMLTAKIMHSCVNHLLSEGDEESLECLCKLLTTIGQNLEKALTDGKKEAEANFEEAKYSKPDQNRRKDELDQNKDQALKRFKEADTQLKDFNNCFKKLDNIVKNKGSGKVSSRVRFMIQDLIDLRNNKWIPRRDDSNPKTIDQIQKEVERETLETNLAFNSPQERKRQDPRSMIDNRKRGGGPDSGGWTTIQSQNRGKFNVEAAKLKLPQTEVEATTLSLGNRSQYIWGQGAAGAKQEEKRPSPQLVGTNMFAALDEKVSEPSSRSSSLKGTSSLTDKDKLISSYKPSVEEEARSSRSGSQQGPGSRSSSRDSQSSLRRDERRYGIPAVKAQAPAVSSTIPPSEPKEPLSPEVLQKKTKLLLDEYLTISDLNEATLCLKDTFDETNMKDFIIDIYYLAFEERGLEPKRAVGKLMTHFIANNDISKEQFFDGLSGVLETLEDLQVDVPMVWDYLAESFVFMVSAEVISLREVAQALIPFKGSQGPAKFLRSLFKLLIEAKGKSWLEQKWIISNIQLGDLIKSDEVENFVQKNDLGFLFSAKVLTMETIKNEISRMIQQKASFDSITAWIDENVGPEKSQKPEFVRTLVTAILEASVIKQQQSYKLDTFLLSQCETLLRRYIEHKEEIELPCLYAVQTFIHKLEHPQGILHSIFDFLWDHEIVSTDSFKGWRDSEDPHEWEGHAVCAKSLTSFFTMLDENETDEDIKS